MFSFWHIASLQMILITPLALNVLVLVCLFVVFFCCFFNGIYTLWYHMEMTVQWKMRTICEYRPNEVQLCRVCGVLCCVRAYFELPPGRSPPHTHTHLSLTQTHTQTSNLAQIIVTPYISWRKALQLWRMTATRRFSPFFSPRSLTICSFSWCSLSQRG